MGSGEQGGVVPGAGEVEIVRLGATTVMVGTGEVDIATTPALADAVATALGAGAEQVEIDLAGVTFMGSSGLACLLEAQRLLREEGARLVLVEPSGAVADSSR